MHRFVILKLILVMLLLGGCASHTTSFGISDSSTENFIARANRLSGWYQAKNYSLIEKQLKSDLKSLKGDEYAEMRLMNELADLYSNLLFDLEQAIELDRNILARQSNKPGQSDYFLKSNSANNRVLADDSYKKNYLNIDNATVINNAMLRLKRNESLLKAKPVTFEQNFTMDELLSYLNDSKKDLAKCYKGTPDYFERASMVIRGEYELFRLTKDSSYINEGYKLILNGDVNIDNIFFSEIDFIALSDYLRSAYFNTRNEKLAEYSLNVLYKPYINIRSHEYRWLYNQMINNRINILIDAYYNKSDFETMLYYISLNKSRMVLEDKVKLLRESSIKSISNDYFDETTGLPNIFFYRKKLASADAYLDFYLDGHYIGEKKQGVNNNMDVRAVYASAGDTAKLRRVSLSGKGGGEFDSDFIYVTYVDKGKVTAKRHDRSAIDKLRNSYSGPIDESAKNKSRRVALGNLNNKKRVQQKKQDVMDLETLVGFKLPGEVTVSPDGWLYSYPLSMILGANVIRTLNVFTYGRPDVITQTRIVGYYNPSLDLPDAEQEKTEIEKLFIGSQSFVRDQAGLEQLRKPIERNILHLSMHGVFNAAAPEDSFLGFAGSIKIDSLGRPVPDDLNKALMVKEMYNLQQLRDNDLVFTAACQTGLTAKGESNESELMGIMRPLLINNNKNIILTLWEVDTRSAAYFVKSFYQNLAKSKNIRTSFMDAREEVKRKYDDPYHWAPYVLVQNN